MYSARSINIPRKSKIVLGKNFGVFSLLNVGDAGSIELSGIVEGERKDVDGDGNSILYRTIKILDMTPIIQKGTRR
jgi:hypothetical protein